MGEDFGQFFYVGDEGQDIVEESDQQIAEWERAQERNLDHSRA